jgi:hypothetical protein
VGSIPSLVSVPWNCQPLGSALLIVCLYHCHHTSRRGRRLLIGFVLLRDRIIAEWTGYPWVDLDDLAVECFGQSI